MSTPRPKAQCRVTGLARGAVKRRGHVCRYLKKPMRSRKCRLTFHTIAESDHSLKHALRGLPRSGVDDLETWTTGTWTAGFGFASPIKSRRIFGPLALPTLVGSERHQERITTSSRNSKSQDGREVPRERPQEGAAGGSPHQYQSLGRTRLSPAPHSPSPTDVVA